MAKLTITRPLELMNRRRPIGLYVDGEKLGNIYNGEAKEFDIPAGSHTLKARIDWCGSREFNFTLSYNETRSLMVTSFGYAYHFMTIFAGVAILDLILVRLFQIRFLLVLLIPFLLIGLYFISFGRNDYLVVKEKQQAQ